jgi:hypothetical protein
MSFVVLSRTSRQIATIQNKAAIAVILPQQGQSPSGAVVNDLTLRPLNDVLALVKHLARAECGA